MTDEELRALIEGGAREALFLYRPFPPPHDGRNLSYFGGLPTLPEHLDWPLSDEGEEITFLCQIDCSALPDFAGRDLLPEQGVLFFFFDTNDGGSYRPEAEVLFHDGDPEGLEERPAPEELPPLYGDDQAYFCIEYLEENPRVFRRWPMDFKVMTSYPERPLSKDVDYLDGRYQEQWQKLQWARLREALGDAFEDLPLRQPSGPQNLVMPTEGFPQAWINVALFARRLFRDVRDNKWRIRIAVSDHQPGQEPPAASDAFCKKIMDSAMDWAEKSDRAGFFEALPPAEWEAFRAWCIEMAKPHGVNGDRIDPEAMTARLQWSLLEGAEACLLQSPEAAKLIPESFVQRLYSQHAPLRSGPFSGPVRHQMLGYGRTILEGAPSAPDHVLLLQANYDAPIDWFWGDCDALQFWIKPEDLAERRFSETLLVR